MLCSPRQKNTFDPECAHQNSALLKPRESLYFARGAEQLFEFLVSVLLLHTSIVPRRRPNPVYRAQSLLLVACFLQLFLFLSKPTLTKEVNIYVLETDGIARVPSRTAKWRVKVLPILERGQDSEGPVRPRIWKSKEGSMRYTQRGWHLTPSPFKDIWTPSMDYKQWRSRI